MSSNALPAQGLQLKMNSAGSPSVFVAIPELVSFTGPGGSGQVIDVTNLDSEAVEKVMGLPDEGQLTFQINHVPTDDMHIALRAARAAHALRSFQIVFPDDGQTTYSFDGYVTGFSDTGGVNATVKASVTIEITGSVTEDT